MNILRAFTSINIVYLPAVVGLYGLTLCLGGIKLWIVLKALRKQIPVSKTLIYSILSWSAGLFTPGKVGEVSLIYFLKQQGIETGTGTGVLLIDKSLTLSTLIACSGVGMFLLFHVKSILLFLLILAAALGTIYILTFWAERITPLRLRAWLANLRASLQTIFHGNTILLLFAFIVAIFKWCITGIAFYIVFLSLGCSCNILFVMIISMTITIINIIPITLHGLGLKEMAAVHFYSLIQIPKEAAVASSLFFSLLAYASALTIIIFFGRHFHSR
jgi:uncharacterized membrane protein YbhN (UPF0104 family)